MGIKSVLIFFSVFLLLNIALAVPLGEVPEGEDEVQSVLNLLVGHGLALKFPDIPASYHKLPPADLTKCVSPLQRVLVEVCLLDSDTSVPLKERFPSLVDCALESIAAYNRDTGAINKQNLKEGLIDQAMVSPEQKKAAGRKLDSCLAETFSIPKIFNGKHQAQTGKSIICIARSLVTNGCKDAA